MWEVHNTFHIANHISLDSNDVAIDTIRVSHPHNSRSNPTYVREILLELALTSIFWNAIFTTPILCLILCSLLPSEVVEKHEN